MNKIKTYGTLAVMASVLFASCAPEVDDTKANYKEAEKAVTTTTSQWSHTIQSGDVTVTSPIITKADSDTRIIVTIDSYARLNMDSVVDALNFYTLSDNSANKFYYPERKNVLSKTIVRAEEPDSYLGTTTIEFSVDTSSVTTNFIAFVADATKLKDKSGSPVLNRDKDDKAGEETDSYICYISVGEKADGTAPTTLSIIHEDECFNNSYLYDNIGYIPDQLMDADGKLTGKLRFAYDASSVFSSYSKDASTGVETKTVDSNLSSALSQIYTLQTKAVGETSWKTTALSFTFHNADDSSNPYAPIAANTYTADTEVLAYGTQWRLVLKHITSGSVPSWIKECYGHDGYFFYSGSKEYTEEISSGTSNIYLTSPVYIYEIGSGSATTFKPTDAYKDAVAEATQTGLLSVVSAATAAPAEWIVEPAYSLSAAEDFIVTNEDNKKVDSTVKIFTDADGEITKIKVALKNKNLGGTFRLWVGSGVTLKAGENTKYPTQVKFGIPADSTRGDVSGYISLGTTTVEGVGIITRIYSSASNDINQYTVRYVSRPSDSENNYVDLKFNFEENKKYKIQIANGYYWDSYYNLTNVGYAPVIAYGTVDVYDSLGSCVASGNYNYSSFSYTCPDSKTGTYTLRLYSQYSGAKGKACDWHDSGVNWYDGYMGVRVYTED